MSYSFTGDWSEALQQSLKSWLIETWTKINGEAPDQDFVEYILVMVKNQKKMSDISNELKDLGIEEAQANDFVKNLQTQLNPTVEKAAESSSARSTDTASSSSKGGVLGPLKTSREKFEGRDGKEGGSSRLLGSALQSSRTKDDNDRRGYDRGGRDDYKRQRYGDRDGRDRDSRDNRDYRDRDGHRKNPPLPPNPPPPQGAPPQPFGAEGGMDTIKYFEHMNQVAQASGFKNAQEMLNSQREMMAMMAPPPVPYYGAPPPHPHYEAPHHAPYYPPPAAAAPYDPALGGVPPPAVTAEYQPAPYGGEYGYQSGRGYSGRGYAGRGGGGRYNSTLAPGRGAGGGGRWYKGGTGRGGDAQGRAESAAIASAAQTGDTAAAAPDGAAPPTGEPVSQSSAGGPSEASSAGAAAASDAPAPSAAPFGVTAVANYSGRGAFRGGRNTFRGGRGYGGRTQAPVNKNKTWTRDTTVDASLVAGR